MKTYRIQVKYHWILQIWENLFLQGWESVNSCYVAFLDILSADLKAAHYKTKQGLTNSQPHPNSFSMIRYVNLTLAMNSPVAICACGERPCHATPRPVVLTHLSTCHVPVLGCVSIRLVRRVRYSLGWQHLTLLDALIMPRYIAL